MTNGTQSELLGVPFAISVIGSLERHASSAR